MKKVHKLLMLTGVICLLAGCQATPEDDIVVNKNESNMAQVIDDTETDADGDSNIPERYQDEFVCPGENIQVTVNAGILRLGEKFPVVKVQPHEVAADEVKKWAEVLFDGRTAHEPGNQYSKSEIEEKILTLKEMSNIDTLLEQYGNAEDAEIMKAYYDEQIEKYEMMYESAPEQVEQKLCDWQFHPSDYYAADAVLYEGNDEFEALKNTYLLYAVAEDLDEGSQWLCAAKRNEKDYKLNRLNYQRLNEGAADNLTGEKMSKEQAVAAADELLERLNLDEWKLWYEETVSDEDGLKYRMTYTPCFSGVQTLETMKGIDLASEDTYAAKYEYSALNIVVSNGEISDIVFESPVEVVEVQNENVKTLSFDEVYERFKTQMQNKYTISSFIQFGDSGMEKEHEIEIRVTKMTEGLFRIREKNEAYSFLMVPTWMFTGEVFIDGESWGETDMCYVNAIDGSIIDPAVGY